MNEYRQKEITEYTELVEQLRDLSGLNWQYQYDGENDRHNLILLGDAPITVTTKRYDNRYSFYLAHRMPYVKTHDLRDNYPEPNKIGVLTKKKILDWVEYLTKVYKDQVKQSNKQKAKVKGHLARMDKIGCKYTKNENNYSYHGSIEKNGIKYSFEIGDTGYISEKLKLAYYYEPDRNIVDHFLKLADNKI